jgi:hypothetical protein
MECGLCHKEMTTADGCEQVVVKTTQGGEYAPIKFGEETRFAVSLKSMPHGARCHDCRCTEGNFHHPGCDVEECPVCHGQLISCGHC